MIDDLTKFLDLAVQLEAEAAEGYQWLAEAMARLGNSEVAELFEKFAGFSRLHLHEVSQRYFQETGHEPLLTNHAFRWPDHHSPERPQAEFSGRCDTPRDALKLALATEFRACDFYSAVAGQTRSPRVQQLAQEFAEEEAEHAAHLERWLARLDAAEA